MTRTLTFTIAAEDAGHDLRYFVRRRLGLSARVLTALKYEGEMRLNGTPAAWTCFPPGTPWRSRCLTRRGIMS